MTTDEQHTMLELAAKAAGMVRRRRSGARRGMMDIVERLRTEVDALQVKIDTLMFEYCPEEMTPEQVDEWGKAQRPVSPEVAAAIDATIKNRDK